MKKNYIIALGIVIVLSIAAFYLLRAPSVSESNEEQTSIAIKDANVTLRGYEFVPEIADITVGGKVTWRNVDGVTHDITFDNGMFKKDILPGQELSLVFNETGEYNYSSKRHSVMKGTIIVK